MRGLAQRFVPLVILGQIMTDDGGRDMA